MTKAVDVARYILEQRRARGHSTTTFTLQKLLYYTQAWMLVATGKPLFEDKIVAWEHGPVVPSIWPYCSGRRFIDPSEIPEGDDRKLDLEERTLVDHVLAPFETIQDSQLGDRLEEMSHKEEPWSKTPRDMEIDHNRMLSYYACVQADPTTPHAAPIPDLSDVATQVFMSDEEIGFIQNLLAQPARKVDWA